MNINDVVSGELANQINTDIIKEVHAIIPTDTKVLNIENQIGKTVKSDDVLLEFVYNADLDSYLDINNLEQIGEDNEILNLYSQSQNSIKLLAAMDGEIVDIKVYVNNKNSVDKKVINLHSDLVKNANDIRKKLESTIHDDKQKIHAIDNMNLNFMKTGGHKYKNVEFIGARIVFFIKTLKHLREGDKIAARSI